jgi:hypothetical protein
MPLEWMGFVRTYECDTSCFLAARGQPLPVWLRRWIDARYLSAYGEPRGDERLSFSFLSLPDKILALSDTPSDKLCFHRAVVLNPNATLADVLVWVASDGDGLPERLHSRSWELLARQLPLRDGAKDQPPVFLPDLWDECISEALGTDPTSWRKTAFGGVGIFAVGPGQDDPLRRVGAEGSFSTLVGVHPDHRVILERNRLTVAVQDRTQLDRVAGGYLLLGALCGRSRHVAWTLMWDIGTLAVRCQPPALDLRAADVLQEAAELQRRGVLARRELRAMDYLGDPRLIALYDRAAAVGALGEYDRRGLDDALGGLDRLVNSIFAVATERSQRRLNQVGFVLALVSLLLTATGLGQLVGAPPDQRQWVFLAWACISLGVVLVLAASRYERRLRAAGSVLRRGRRADGGD